MLTFTADPMQAERAAHPIPRKRRTIDGVDDSDDGGSNDGGHTEDEARMMFDDADSGSEASSIRSSSTAGTGVDVSDVDASDDDADDEDDQDKLVKAKAADGSYVVWNNGYFTRSNHPAYPDIKISMHDVWAKPGLMLKGDNSKARKIAKYSPTNDPYLAETVCRAWMLYRSSLHNFLKTKKRMHWWQSELAELQTRIQNLGQPKGTTGCAQADKEIRAWCPQAFVSV